MNFASPRNRRAFSLIEVLVVVSIVLLFFGAASLSIIQFIRSKEKAQARMEAVANARHAVDTIAKELRVARMLSVPGGGRLFFGQTAERGAPFTGDRIDNDVDFAIDEEIIRGRDDDGDFVNQHVQLKDPTAPPVGPGNVYERPYFFNADDLGDQRVDEDVQFTTAEVEFHTQPDGAGVRRVRFYLDSFDGEDNVLLMQATTDVGGPDEQASLSPIAHNVLSFSLLFWDPNGPPPSLADPYTRYYQRTWNSDNFTTGVAAMRVPSTIHIRVTTYAGSPQPLGEMVNGPALPIESVTLSTVVNVEQVLGSAFYNSRRPPMPSGLPIAP